MRSIAFRSPNWLGDAVMSTVVPPAVKRANPGARLTVLTPEGLTDVFSRAESVDEVVGLARGREVDAYRRGGYDLVLLGPTSFGSAWRALRGGAGSRCGFSTSGRGLLLARRLPGREYRRDRHQVENYRALAALCGEPRANDGPRVEVDPAWTREAGERWPARPDRRRVALQPGATFGPAKRWAAERFAQVAGSLRRHGASVAVLGGPGDAASVRRVLEESPDGVLDLSGDTRVGVLAALLQSADLLVTNDTGPMHLAAAVGTRTLALFGSTSPTWTRPWGRGHRVIEHPVPCAPCFQRTCRIGYLCLEGIAAERVATTAREMLEERTR